MKYRNRTTRQLPHRIEIEKDDCRRLLPDQFTHTGLGCDWQIIDLKLQEMLTEWLQGTAGKNNSDWHIRMNEECRMFVWFKNKDKAMQFKLAWG
jgi:hypothetical protein